MARRSVVRGFGAWYDDKQGDSGDLWHRTLIDPPLLARIDRLPKGARLLDVGCGNGYISRYAARHGAQVTGVDRSKELIGRARARERRDPLGVVYLLADAAHLGRVPGAPFDLAISNMALMDIADASGALRGVSRSLTRGGRLLFTISHPCFDVDTRSGWIVDYTNRRSTVFRKVAGYRTPHSDTFDWPLPDGRVARTAGHHRPLSWYVKELNRLGFVIVDLEEPAPLPEYVGHWTKREWLEEIPLHLFVEARYDGPSPTAATLGRSRNRSVRAAQVPAA